MMLRDVLTGVIITAKKSVVFWFNLFGLSSDDADVFKDVFKTSHGSCDQPQGVGIFRCE